MRHSQKDSMVVTFNLIGATMIAIFTGLCLIDAAQIGLLTPGWFTGVVSFPDIDWQQLTEQTQ